MDERTLATIKLDGQEGRGELFIRGGRLWCRFPDGEEGDTCMIHGLTDEAGARADICTLYGSGPWDLKMVEQRMTLREFHDAGNCPTVLCIVSVGSPGGFHAAIGDENDTADDLDLWDLEGEMDPIEAGKPRFWRWLGEGDPKDFNGNTIQRIDAWGDAEHWERLANGDD